MARHTHRRRAGVLAVAALITALALRSHFSAPGNPGSIDIAGHTGELIASVRTEPQSFNWLTRRDATTHLVSLLTQARLVEVNARTQEVEPWLAEGWTRSSDGRRYTVRLRPGLCFSDGVPLTADDVVFSLAAAFDPASTIREALLVGGQPLTASVIDPATVEITFPGPFGPGLRLLDNLPILPKHTLNAVFGAGMFARAWSVSADPREIVGAGPFVLSEYAPGEHLVFTRNPHYFRRDSHGRSLPYLDRVVIQVIPDQEGQTLSMQTGETDTSASEIRPEDVAPLRRLAAQGRLQIVDLGVALDPDGFWINLTPEAFDHDSRRTWIQRDELRQAISLSVDRQLFADTVFFGAASPVFGPVTPANRAWYSAAVPQRPYDIAAARALLATIGLADRDGDGFLEDETGTRARLTLLTAKGQTALERGAAVIREELKKIGLTVDVVPLEGNALVQRFISGRAYDAVYFHLSTTDTDPALNMDFWMSHGSAHVWNLGQQAPATPWERQIDGLMTRQAAALDVEERRVLFAQVQTIFAEHAPMVYFAAPRVFVAASTRMTNLTPAISRPQLLWAADTIAIKRP